MADPEPAADTAAVDALVQQILRGERVLLLPPGTAAFVAANLLLLLGAAACAVPAMPMLLPALHPAVAPLLAGVPVLPSALLPGLLVARGAPTGALWMQRVLWAWLALALLGAALVLAGVAPSLGWGPALATGALLAALALVRGRAWRGFALFLRRLAAARVQRRGEAGARR